ncbi:MAG: hypothetical protein K9L62_08220 [Vallitaleaceae bacterium]|nr:hypothetical protein [Vallitaleaceae bacterium]
MKIFRKMLILKWHYIEHECIEFGDINFLTGKNGSGKSTLIDALQLVLLGETNGNFFNKAANEKSQRTLNSYVRGELTDNEDTGFNYLRNDDFSSIIALEVKDTMKRKSFVIGIHMDVHSDGSLNHKYFIMEGLIPKDHFIRDEMVMEIGELRSWCKSENIRLEQFATNKGYREALMAKLGHINQKFFSLFKKAVPFSPIVDIKGFITEFICDTDKKVDIKNMQDNIRYYEKMKLEAEDVDQRVKDLTAISEVYKETSQLEQLEKQQWFITDKGREQMAAEYVEKERQRLIKEEKELDERDLLVKGLQLQMKATKDEIGVLNRQLAKSDVAELEKKYKEKINRLSEQIHQVTKDREALFLKLRLRSEKWLYNCKDRPTGLDRLIVLESMFKTEDVEGIDLQELYKMNTIMEEQIGLWKEAYYESHKWIKDLKEQMGELKKDIEGLKKGQKMIPIPVTRLQQVLEETLGPVPMLCDVVEIKDEKWQNAIEAYLHLQKFHLIVAPKDYVKALEIYEQLKEKENIYDVGLVDLQKVLEHGAQMRQGSLAEEIEVEDVLVKSYVNYLLGSVMKVDRVEELRKHRTSMTPTCMLYKNYVARNLNPERYRVPFIGKNAAIKQLTMKEMELKALSDRLSNLLKGLDAIKTKSELTGFGKDMLDQLSDKIEAFRLLPEHQKHIHELKEQLASLDRSSVMDLMFKLEDLERKEKALDDHLVNNRAKLIALEESIKDNKLSKIPHALKNHELLLTKLNEKYDKILIEVGQQKFEEALIRLGQRISVVNNYESAAKATGNKKEKKWKELVEKRSEYVRRFQGTFDIYEKNNDKYDSLLDKLARTDLPIYKEKIENAIKIAQQEFKDDFLSKLKYNIDVVREQINELNDALKNMSFGKDTYAFKMTPNSYYRRYYDMIMDPNLLDDFNIFSFGFQEKYGDVIEELFKKIVDVGEGAISSDERVEIEKNIEKYTDYRTYLDFDLVVTDQNGNKSHLSKMISKKSGGETQTPFYISVLASFFRVYRMNTKAKDTVRLIVFDEAFSKMDHERIEQCIILLKELGFQALISAPSEKIANITPLVDKTLCVMRMPETTVIKGFTKEELNVL